MRISQHLHAAWLVLAIATATTVYADTKVEHPERFTSVQEWDLTVTWNASAKMSHTMKDSPLSMLADVSFSGTFTTVLRPAEDGCGWNNAQDAQPTWSAAYQANHRIKAHLIPDTVWVWQGKGDPDPEAKPSAELFIDLEKGTYRLDGSMYYVYTRTRTDVQPPQINEGQSSIYLRALAEEDREPTSLPSSGQDLSGSAVIPAAFDPFAGFPPQAKPRPTMSVQWQLRPRPASTRFEYRPSLHNIEALRWDNIPIGHEVGREPNTKKWLLHSNWEGQVYVDGKPQLVINTAPEIEDRANRVDGHYAIRRLSRTWWMNDNTDYKATRSDIATLPNGWNYDSNELEEDWLDQAAASMLPKLNWPVQATLDEFLVGVADLDPSVVNVPANAIRSTNDAVRAARDYPGREYFQAIAGLEAFQFAYVSYIIEVRPFPNHRKVFRITYHVEENLTLESYQAHYQSKKPGWNYPWETGGGWKEVVPDGKGWKVIDFTPNP